jgi:asparagine synthase (glutamine-hydrolysing)
MSDRPIGCLLSGGLDSSIITSIVCKLIGPENVKTYSIGMKGSTDLFFAKKVSEYLGTKHTEILFTPQEGFEAIHNVIKDIESYDITTIRASIAMWLAAKYISKNTDNIVLLSGEGADELFCGYLYFHNAPNITELENESTRLIKELYMYDVLRADRCISSHGLELRVPFLDRRLVDICQSLSGDIKGPQNGIEKSVLRKAFEGYLPDDVLWRRKDGMSDGISGNSGKKWHEQITDFVNEKITPEEFYFYKNSFPSIEAYYYKVIYNNLFPTYNPKYNYWLPKWTDHNGDPSGRNIKIFKECPLLVNPHG